MHVAKIDTDHQAEAVSMATTLKDLIAAKNAVLNPLCYWDKPLPWPGAKPHRMTVRRPKPQPTQYVTPPGGLLKYTGAMYDTIIIDDLDSVTLSAQYEAAKQYYFQQYYNKSSLWKVGFAPYKALANSKEIIALLDTAIAFMEPENWTKGALARDRNGRPVNPDSPHAVKWCGMGYLYRVLGAAFRQESPLTHYLERAVGEISGGRTHGLPKFNDAAETSVEDVRDVFCRARSYALAYGG